MQGKQYQSLFHVHLDISALWAHHRALSSPALQEQCSHSLGKPVWRIVYLVLQVRLKIHENNKT